MNTDEFIDRLNKFGKEHIKDNNPEPYVRMFFDSKLQILRSENMFELWLLRVSYTSLPIKVIRMNDKMRLQQKYAGNIFETMCKAICNKAIKVVLNNYKRDEDIAYRKVMKILDRKW